MVEEKGNNLPFGKVKIDWTLSIRDVIYAVGVLAVIFGMYLSLSIRLSVIEEWRVTHEKESVALIERLDEQISDRVRQEVFNYFEANMGDRMDEMLSRMDRIERRLEDGP